MENTIWKNPCTDVPKEGEALIFVCEEETEVIDEENAWVKAFLATGTLEGKEVTIETENRVDRILAWAYENDFIDSAISTAEAQEDWPIATIGEGK